MIMKNFDPSSFSHVTRMFVCKQTVISFGVLFVLKCFFLIYCWHINTNKIVTVISNVNQNCCQNRCTGCFKISFRRILFWNTMSSFKVATLLFTRAKGLENDQGCCWSCKSAPWLNWYYIRLHFVRKWTIFGFQSQLVLNRPFINTSIL